MSDTINILHITDAHIRPANKDDVRRRVEALIGYLVQESLHPDLIAFTGDLTYTGAVDEFELFDECIASPIKRKLQINEARFLILPGNHDIQRDAITVADHQRLRRLNNARAAELEFRAISVWPRLQNYLNYQSEHTPRGKVEYPFKEYNGGLFNTRKLKIKGLDIGVACLNSAWLCAGDDDKRNLFLSEFQVAEALRGLASCDLKIALCHHPADWYHESESELACLDLRRDFQLILTGHLRKPVSISELDASAHSVSLSSRALFDGKVDANVDDGFQFYRLDVTKRSIEVFFRKYIRKRNTFDKDTDHAQDGRHSFDLPIPLALHGSSAIVAQKLAVESNAIAKEIRSTLALLQGTDNPVFVTPKIRAFEFRGGARKTSIANVAIADLFERSVVVCGAQDAGKTIILKTIAADSERATGRDAKKSARVYVGGSDLPLLPSASSLTQILELKLGYSVQDLDGLSLTIMVDGLGSHESEWLEVISRVCDERQWTFIVGMGDFVADVIAQKPEYKHLLFVEVQPWGPSRIREFAVKLFEGTQVNADLAYKFVSECLRTVDLPATPTVVSLYMSVFSKVGAEISSLSFLRLLEKIEQIRLGADEGGTVDSLYNRRKILQLLAVAGLNTGSVYMERSEATRIVESYFLPKNLPIDATRVLEKLITCGILREDDALVGFSHFVFFDYYLALAFKDRLIDDADFTDEIAKCTRVTYALSLFAGLDRENLSLARRLMDTVEKTRHASSELMLVDLDAHITDLLMPERRKSSEADAIARESLAECVDYDALDDEYAEQKRAVAETRADLLKKGVDRAAGDLEMQVQGLHAFYSIFRNLENIDGEWKRKYLDRILDYHITTNFFLIDFYFGFSKDKSFRTFAAYMLTWTGHSFMAASLGNPTLCRTIRDVLDDTKNDLKQLLLLLLLSELEDPSAEDRIEMFIGSTESRAATEIMFVHLRQKLIVNESKILPARLVDLFKQVFIKRQTRFVGAKNVGEAKNDFNATLKAVKREHWTNLRQKSPVTNDPKEAVVKEI